MAKKNVKGGANKRPRKAKLGIYERIFNVQQGIKAVMKTGKNTHHSYNYATERDILAEVKPLLGAQRLVVLSSTKEHAVDGMKHKVGVDFTIVNIDNPEEKVTELFYGYGEDKAGSAVGLPIAYTMAQKYHAAKYFMVETGDEAEADQHSGVDEKKGARGAANKPAESPEQAVETIKRMIAGSRNIDGLLEYQKNSLPKIAKFTKAQKTELDTLISARVNELQAPPQAASGDSVVDALMDVAQEGRGKGGQKKLL